jgi:hypothetical protein
MGEELSTTNLGIIGMVALVSFVTCALIALGFYAIDRNAERNDQQD